MVMLKGPGKHTTNVLNILGSLLLEHHPYFLSHPIDIEEQHCGSVSYITPSKLLMHQEGV